MKTANPLARATRYRSELQGQVVPWLKPERGYIPFLRSIHVKSPTIEVFFQSHNNSLQATDNVSDRNLSSVFHFTELPSCQADRTHYYTVFV